MFDSFLSFAFPQTIQQKISKTLDNFYLNSNQPLPQNYENLLYISHQNFSQSFAGVISSLPKASTPSAIIKLITLILKGIRNKECTIEILQKLQQLQTPLMSQIQQRDISWINQITIAIKSYLARLPSLHQSFQRALSKQPKLSSNYQIYLSDLYIILNTTALLFPAVTNCINNIGRYYFKTYLYFAQFYKVLKEQILITYQYIQSIISIFKVNYKNYDVVQLECFAKTISQIQLYCDRVEQFTMNKYFRGKGPSKKIYFKEEEIDQINYFIQSSKVKNNKNDDFNYTNDEQLFGDFQQ